MKNYIFLFLLILPFLLLSQKHDNNWMFGVRTPNISKGGLIDFNNSLFSADSSAIGITMTPSSMTMSDSLGNLQFYTNTYRVANAQHQIMPHGAIAEGDTMNSINTSGLLQSTSVILLSNTSNPFQYYLIKQVYDADPQNYIYVYHLKYCLIDMTADSGKGDVVQKNISIINDTIVGHALSATKHANGKDWWIVSPEYRSKNYWITQITANGVISSIKQQIQATTNIKINEEGSSTFSPDGSLYIRYDQMNGGQMHIWHFDRCRGLLHTPLHFDYAKPANQGALGVCVSPNNQFLYLCHGNRLIQFDLTAPNILASQKVIYTVSLAQGSFNQIGLAPDGKIYIRGALFNFGTDAYRISVINQPDSVGIACDFQPSAIVLPNQNTGLVPNYPNYRLGPLVCDSTNAIVEGFAAGDISIYPNPAQDIVNLTYNTQYYGKTVALHTLNGMIIDSFTLPEAGTYSLDLGHLSKGIYLLKISNAYFKLVVQ